MATTPLIRTPQADGGSFYTFSSGARDLSKTLNNDNLRFVFSKFVLLNIPNFDKIDFSTFSNYQNYMQFDTIDGNIWNGGLKGDPNTNWAESFQNYALNLEELVLAQDEYDETLLRTPAERVFFKWLKETGAIRFREATDDEASGNNTGTVFIEENESDSGSVRYNRVVKYIGDIDVVNNVEKGGEAYTEVYINVPTEVGNTPTILFDSIADANYSAGLSFQGESEYIEGRNSATQHPQGLDILAFYDVDNAITYTDADANWMNQPQPTTTNDAYFTEPTFADASNDDIRKYPADYDNPAGFSGSAYRRNKLDGISVNFDPNDYKQIIDDSAVSTIQEFNSSPLASNFEFNAVLVYYDMIDLSNPNNTATNLYGILLVDNITPTTEGGFIQRYDKFRPNSITGQNGNSYGLKLNLRFDASPGSSGIDTIINEYNTFSLGLYTDALVKMQEAVNIFTRQQVSLTELIERVSTLENLVNTTSEIETLEAQISLLREQLENSQLSLANQSSILDLINANRDAINKLINGNTSLTLQYNTDVLYPLAGIDLDKSAPDRVGIKVSNQEYNLSVLLDSDGDEINETNPINLNQSSPLITADLLDFTNMIRVNSENTALNNLVIRIDDTTTRWQKNQVIRIVFENTITMNSNKIIVETDADDRIGNGEWGVEIASIDPSEFITNKPIIEIICIDASDLIFKYDILR